MDEMKYDMGGAASVLGTFRAIGEMNLKLNVIGIIARAKTCRRAAPPSRATSSPR
jgi:leucyl aminopeptidase